jgi:toxin-antitoxin system PIN domain toxin
MKRFDANVPIAAVDQPHAQHAIAHGWLESARAGGERIALATVVALAFLRITTKPRISQHPLDSTQALGWLHRLGATPTVRWLHPGPDHLHYLSLYLSGPITDNRFNDAHLAALAREHGASVVRFDRNFLRFAELRREVPAP